MPEGGGASAFAGFGVGRKEAKSIGAAVGGGHERYVRGEMGINGIRRKWQTLMTLAQMYNPSLPLTSAYWRT